MDELSAVEIRLREISDQIVQLRTHLEDHPANGFLIELLELERATHLKDTIKIV